MSQLKCNECDYLWSDFSARAGDRCGVRLNGKEWCGGTLEEHQCGGPKEACGLRNCEECGRWARKEVKP